MSKRTFYRSMVGTAVITYTPTSEKCWATWPLDNPTKVFRSAEFRATMNKAKQFGGVEGEPPFPMDENGKYDPSKVEDN